MQVKPGDTAWVQGGPFMGFQGQVVQINLDGTAMIQLDVFGRSARAELNPDLLGLAPPDSGVAGVREPRRPIAPADAAAISAPLPDE